MRGRKIRTLVINPNKHPKISYIKPSLKNFQIALGTKLIEHGEVEAKKIDACIYVLFNKDRFLANLEANRKIDDDIIAGTMYIVATNKKGLPISLTDKQISKYALRFWKIETFDDIEVAEANLNTLFARFLID